MCSDYTYTYVVNIHVFLCLFETGSYYLAHVDLEFMALLTQLSQ